MDEEEEKLIGEALNGLVRNAVADMLFATVEKRYDSIVKAAFPNDNHTDQALGLLALAMVATALGSENPESWDNAMETAKEFLKDSEDEDSDDEDEAE